MEITKEIPYGYCHCGCGKKTTVAKANNASRNMVSGKPMRFIRGHYSSLMRGKDSPSWKGGRYIMKHGNTEYFRVQMPDHPRSDNYGYVLEHILVVEKTFSCPLPKGSVVHHVDFDGLNNEPTNLMVFKNQSEHMKFHRLIKND